MIYVDANVLVYAAADETEKGILSREIISAIQNGKLPAITSVLTLDETVWALRKILGQDSAILACSAFCHLPGLEIKNVTRAVFLNSLEEMKHNKLKPRDALHVATMKISGVTDIVSNDSDFDKSPDIKRVTLAEAREKIKIPTAPEGRGIIGKDVGIFNVANTLSGESASETHPSQATGYLQQIK